MDVAGVIAIEQHEEPAILVSEAAVELDRQSVRFSPLTHVVVDADPLPRIKAMGDDLDLWSQPVAERRLHLLSKTAEHLGRDQRRKVQGQFRVTHVELELLVEVGLD